MARSHSSEDSDSSPRTPRSSSSTASVVENLESVGGTPAADPESLNAAHQSSDESTSSDGVLVELPFNNEQGSRSLPGDPDSGILVNIDGSMQEQQEREDLFMDASDHLGSGGRTPKVGDSISIVDAEDTSRRRRPRGQDLERERLLARLDATSAECQKYKEEREAFGREVVDLRTQLQGLVDQQCLNREDLVEYHRRRLGNRDAEHDVLASPIPLDSMVKDCSRFVVNLKGVLDERSNSASPVLNINKDLEIEVLQGKILEYDVFQDVLMSYIGSVIGEWSEVNVIKRRLLTTLASVNRSEGVPSVELFDDGISLIEKRTVLLVEKYNQLLLEIEQLGQFLEEMKPGSSASQENELGFVISVAREELLESKKKEGELVDKIRELEEENGNMAELITVLKKGIEEADVEVSNTKKELEQAESRFLASKEKLSIAVTKGKQLVQHRDTLKHSLAGKANELEKCMQELQQKANALEAMEANNEELKQLLSEKTSALEKSLLELQDKSCILGNTEATVEDLRQLIQEKTSELEKCLLEFQDKSDILGSTEATVEELKQLLQEKTSDLEKCLLELQLKSDALDTVNTNAEEVNLLFCETKNQLENCFLELQQRSKNLETAAANEELIRQSFTEKSSELEKCLVSLKQRSDALEITEATVQQLKQSLAKKDIEVENSLLELLEKSVLMTAAFSITKEINETQNLLRPLQDSSSYKDEIIRDIEESILVVDFPQYILSIDIVDKVRWLVNQKCISDGILQEFRSVKDALISANVPEAISSDELCSQVDWLLRSFTECKDELSKLQSGVTHSRMLHELEVSEALKEVDILTLSLFKEKEENDSLRIEHEDLKLNHEKLAEKVTLISSEKESLMDFVKEINATILDDRPSLDLDTMLGKSIAIFRKRMKTSLNDGKKLERMQCLLHVTHVELSLFERVLEDLLMDDSKLTSLSYELGRALDETHALRNEKESMQKELQRLEERNSLIRDKLSMAVKKGKGLVQEREGFKLTLDERNSEIEKLRKELQLQESKVCEYMERINNFSAYPEQILKLEVDIASLKDKIMQSEHLLNESNGYMQKLADSINDIVLRTDRIFEAPIEKVNWISGYINELENSKAYLEEELEKEKNNVTFNFSRLAEALETIKSLEMELHHREKYIHDIDNEKNIILINKSKAEDELEKGRVENFMQSNKLADAYATMKNLQAALLLAEDKVSVLDAEKIELESKSKQEIRSLNTKVAQCMEELVKAQSTSENQKSEFLSELRQLEIFIKDEGLFPLMIEQFHKNSDGLRQVWLLIQDIHNQLVAKGAQTHPEMKHVAAFASLSSLPNFEDFIENEILRSEVRLEDTGDVTSSKKMFEKLYQLTRLLNGRFTGLTRFLDNQIAFTLQALQAARDEFIHTLNLSESLKLNIEKLEDRNQALEHEISSLKTEVLRLLSACNDATQELLEVHDLSGFDSDLKNIHSAPELRSPAPSQGESQKKDDMEYSKAAENLLVTCRNLVKINRDMSTSLNTLKHKVSQAEMTAETTIEERNLVQERVSKLEGDMEALQNICNGMKAKLNDYQSKEDSIKVKEMELMRLENSLTAKERGAVDELISKGQVETIFDKVNKLVGPADSTHLSQSQSQELYFATPLDKLFYVIDSYSELVQRVHSLTYEKEDLQLILETHVREIENLKNSAESTTADHRDLESKKLELSELTSILEKITRKLATNYTVEDLKPVTAMRLLQALEKQAIALSVDLENSKSKVHELGTKLQAKDMVVNELSTKVKYLEESHARTQQPDVVKERTVFEPSPSIMGPEITEIEDVGAVGMSSKAPTSASAHVRTMRKGSNDHLVLNIGTESEYLLTAQETNDKGHVFKSLNTSGLIPKQGRLIADRVDGIWVSGGRMLMSEPRARLGLMVYWIFLHLWVLGSIL